MRIRWLLLLPLALSAFAQGADPCVAPVNDPFTDKPVRPMDGRVNITRLSSNGPPSVTINVTDGCSNDIVSGNYPITRTATADPTLGAPFYTVSFGIPRLDQKRGTEQDPM